MYRDMESNGKCKGRKQRVHQVKVLLSTLMGLPVLPYLWRITHGPAMIHLLRVYLATGRRRRIFVDPSQFGRERRG